MSLIPAAFLFTLTAAALPAAPQETQSKKPQVVKSNKDTSGETIFEGKLIDAQCHGDEKCRVSEVTKEFGLILPDGTYLKFDEGGNEKVKLFLGESARGRKMLTAEVDAAKRLTVKASGTRTGDTFNLESIQ